MNFDSLAFGSYFSIPSLSYGEIYLEVADHFPRILSKSTTLVLFETLEIFNQDEIYGL
jgi:hypothetical protein